MEVTNYTENVSPRSKRGSSADFQDKNLLRETEKEVCPMWHSTAFVHSYPFRRNWPSDGNCCCCCCFLSCSESRISPGAVGATGQRYLKSLSATLEGACAFSWQRARFVGGFSCPVRLKHGVKNHAADCPVVPWFE